MINSIIKEEFAKQGYEELTPIQKAVFEPLATNQNVLGLAPTGSGKTLAYVLPLLGNLLPDDGTQLLILAPSQELGMQITEVIRPWAKQFDLKVTPIIGGANVKRQIEKLKKRPEIIVGTPGRILNLVHEKKIKLHTLRTLVIDEADDLLQEETLDACRELVGAAPSDVQLAFFSATETPILAELPKWFGQGVQIFDTRQDDTTQGEVRHYLVEVPTRKRLDALRRLGNMEGFYGLVFFKKTSDLLKAYDKLKHHDVKVAKLSGEEKKQAREKALKSMRKREIALLLTTDVAARGLDIPKLPAVVNFDLPKDSNTYIHRVGRTGRMGADGVVINLGNEHDLRNFKQLVAQENYDMLPGYLYKGKLVTEAEMGALDEEEGVSGEVKKKKPKKKDGEKKADKDKKDKKKKHKKDRKRDKKNKGKRKK